MSSSPDVADALAQRSIRLGRALSVAPTSEALGDVRAYLGELRSFAADVRQERWYATQYLRWVEAFVALVGQAERVLPGAPSSVAVLLEVRIGGALFDYRLCSYQAAAELGMRRAPASHKE